MQTITDEQVLEYIENANRTINQQQKYPPVLNWALGLCGEATEISKLFWGIDTVIHPSTDAADELKKELGDLIWYINALCEELIMPLIYFVNQAKLEDYEYQTSLKEKVPAFWLSYSMLVYSGEISEIVKKTLFHRNKDVFDEDSYGKIYKNIGYMVLNIYGLAKRSGFTLLEIMQANNQKLKERHPDKFSGDYRNE
jgi:NTP pyrophosphatase (non-canonical NTP hydrolase)